MNMNKGTTIWITGLPCAGKTTIGEYLVKKHLDKKTTIFLDGDIVREIIRNRDMSLEGRTLHLSYMAFCCREFNSKGINVVSTFISPTNKIRKEITKIIGKNNIINVWARCERQVCIKRDVKGMWKKALKGKIKQFTSISGSWNEPDNCDIIVNTDVDDVETCAKQIMDKFNKET